MTPAADFVTIKQSAVLLPSIALTRRQLCDVEMILNGAFTPLTGFMTAQQYDAVVETMRLPDGKLFPIPVTLDVEAAKASELRSCIGSAVGLKDEEGNIIAVLTVRDVYRPDKAREAKLVFGGDKEHPAIAYLTNTAGEYYVGGDLVGVQLPPHYDHNDLRLTPTETRALLRNSGWKNVVAFQTRNPLHRAHFELTVRACAAVDSGLLLHPVVGMTKPGDIDHHTRVKCYRAIMPMYEEKSALLSVIPLAMRMAGPREAILHAIVRQNYGATHFIIGRDHAGPGSNSAGKDFYSPFEARDAALAVQSELKIQLLPFDQMVYVPAQKHYLASAEVPPGTKVEKLSGTEVRKRLASGAEIPEWFSFPSVVAILRSAHPPLHKQGYCVFFTGLSGSGKSTIANALVERLMSLDTRPTTLLDGDHCRQMLSSELGFSTEHRNLNIKRIGFVSSLIVKSGGAVIAAPIAPYHSSRLFARQSVEQFGGFIEVYMSTPIAVCEQRDRKGLYAKARKGLLLHFTGIDDPYEEPTKPDVVIKANTAVSDAVDQISIFIRSRGYIQ